MDPTKAFETWDQQRESLEDVERRIHDGVPLENLHTRADDYLDAMRRHFPWALPRPGSLILEIGSGVGYIMESAHRKFRPSQIIGLDVAPQMVAKAKERLRRITLSCRRASFYTTA